MTPAPAVTTVPAPLTLTPSAFEALTGGTWHWERRASDADPTSRAGARRSQNFTIRGAAIDSRLVREGILFACLPGTKVDGHDFAAQAAADGAALILAQRPLHLPVPVLVVADVAAALLALGAEARRRLPHTRWLAVGGANGKTTTKELLAAACRGSGLPVHVTAGNFNNHLGVPLTLLATPADAAYAVIEVGTNNPGEIAPLAAAVAPHHALVTSIGPEHLEGFGDLAGVAREEASLFAAVAPDGTCLAGLHGLADHAQAHDTTVAAIADLLRQPAGKRPFVLLDDALVPTGLGQAVHGLVGALGIRLETTDGLADLPLLGAHNLANAALAFAAATAAGVAPADALKGLSTAAPVAGRLVPRPAGLHLILDDTYNANPASMVAGLHALAKCPGAKLAILGFMGELGSASEAGHRSVGAACAALGLPLITVNAPLIAAGARAAGHPVGEVADHHAATSLAKNRLAAGSTTVLVKASRSQALERVVDALLKFGSAPC